MRAVKRNGGCHHTILSKSLYVAYQSCLYFPALTTRDLGRTFSGLGPVHSVCLIFYDSFGTVLRFFVLRKFGIRYDPTYVRTTDISVHRTYYVTTLFYVLRTRTQAWYRVRITAEAGGRRTALACTVYMDHGGCYVLRREQICSWLLAVACCLLPVASCSIL